MKGTGQQWYTLSLQATLTICFSAKIAYSVSEVWSQFSVYFVRNDLEDLVVSQDGTFTQIATFFLTGLRIVAIITACVMIWVNVIGKKTIMVYWVPYHMLQLVLLIATVSILRYGFWQYLAKWYAITRCISEILSTITGLLLEEIPVFVVVLARLNEIHRHEVNGAEFRQVPHAVSHL